jgi:DUF1365 family protein
VLHHPGINQRAVVFEYENTFHPRYDRNSSLYNTPCEHQNELSFYISPEKLKLYFVYEKNSPTAFADLTNYIITKVRQLQGNQCLIQV